MISLDMINILMEKGGLSKQQAQSATAEVCVKLFMDDDGKLLLEETQRQLNQIVVDARKEVSSLACSNSNARRDLHSLLSQIESCTKTVSAIVEAQGEYGKVEDSKAKDTLALYGALLAMNEKTNADDNVKLRCASYVVWAYLGGEASTKIYADFWKDDKDEKNTKSKYKRYDKERKIL